MTNSRRFQRLPWLPELVESKRLARNIKGHVSTVITSHSGRTGKPFEYEWLCMRCNTCQKVKFTVHINRRNAVTFSNFPFGDGVTRSEICDCEV